MLVENDYLSKNPLDYVFPESLNVLQKPIWIIKFIYDNEFCCQTVRAIELKIGNLTHKILGINGYCEYFIPAGSGRHSC